MDKEKREREKKKRKKIVEEERWTLAATLTLKRGQRQPRVKRRKNEMEKQRRQ